MPTLLAWALSKLSKPVLIAFAFAALLAIAGLGAWRASTTVTDYLAKRDAQVERMATAAERNHWLAQIEKSNAEVAAARLAQAKAAFAADAAARAAAARHTEQLAELETRNAALPNAAAPALSRERVRLLARPPARRAN
ncbi:hypothetical protein ACJ4V0_15500 [Phreatobacter sp. HK31-P]